ncbi:hypothetical protein GEMRC1_012739 [Eukaryota sp. GEM-RC1]
MVAAIGRIALESLWKELLLPSPSPNSFSALTVEYAKQLCQGISYLHSKSVVHGDLKPGNVVVVDGRIRIADFGTSRNIASTSTVPRTGAMTVRYAAPEQFENTFTPHSDIYSLGIVLYELFENKEAFEGMSMYGLVGAKQRGISLQFDECIPTVLVDVINRCLRVDPVQRPRIFELIDVLENLTVYEPVLQQIDNSLLLEKIDFLQEKNQSQVDQIHLLRAGKKQLNSKISQLEANNIHVSKQHCNDFLSMRTQFEHQILLLNQTISNLQNEIHSLNETKNPIKLGESVPRVASASGKSIEGSQLSTRNQNSLNCSSSEVSNTLKEVLEGLKGNNTTIIVLANNSIGIEKVRELADTLKVNSSVTIEGTKALAEALKVNTTITRIYLRCNSIGAEGTKALAEALKVNTTVTRINLRCNSIGAEGTKALAEALKVNTTVTRINLRCNSIGAEGTKALAEALKVNTTVTRINLRCNSIGAEGTKALAEALKVNTTVTRINLRCNSIGAEGTKALAEALKVNSSVKTLFLGTNSIGCEAAGVLGEALKLNATVSCLFLGANYIRADGALALAAVLKVNTTLTSLDLYGNSIGAEGASAFADALKLNKTLTSMDLYGNSIGAEGACALADSLKVSTGVVSIFLGSNSIDDKGVKALSKALKVNNHVIIRGLEISKLKSRFIYLLSFFRRPWFVVLIFVLYVYILLM